MVACTSMERDLVNGQENGNGWDAVENKRFLVCGKMVSQVAILCYLIIKISLSSSVSYHFMNNCKVEA